MKSLLYNVFLLMGVALGLSSCEKDNYEPPKSVVTGRLVYKGETFPYNGNSDTPAEAEIFQLYQDGFGKKGAFAMRVSDEGEFSALLFDGEYTMKIKDQQYPFVWDEWPMENGKPAAQVFNLQKSKNFDIKITPYFEINNIEFASGANITAKFKIDQVIPGAKVKRALLYVSTAVSVNKGTPASQIVNVSDISSPVTIKIPIQKYRDSYVNNSRTYAYVRIAVETDKAAEFLWSKVYKVEDLPVKLNDVTADYLKNAGPGFKTTPGSVSKDYTGSDVALKGLEATPADWYVNDAVKIYNGFGAIDQRWDRDRLEVINWDVCKTTLILNGKVYQTAKLPAGKYMFSVKVAEHAGGADRCFLAVDKGTTLPDWENKTKAFAYADVELEQAVEFTITEETQMTLGFLYNFPKYGQTCGFGFDYIKIYKLD